MSPQVSISTTEISILHHPRYTIAKNSPSHYKHPTIFPWLSGNGRGECFFEFFGAGGPSERNRHRRIPKKFQHPSKPVALKAPETDGVYITPVDGCHLFARRSPGIEKPSGRSGERLIPFWELLAPFLWHNESLGRWCQCVPEYPSQPDHRGRAWPSVP